MEFGVLGDLVVTNEATDRTPRGQRGRDLLAVLLLRHDRPVSPEVLLDLVWGEEAPLLDVSVVHTQMARLRRAIGAEQVSTTPTGYRLNSPATDADRFLALFAQARAGQDRDRAITVLEEGLRLWRGPRPFADVTDGIAAGECARLADARLAAEELLVELLLAGATRDDAVRALQLARDELDREPMRERAYELAMLAAARLDEQAEALQTYDRLRAVLREELGVDPGRSVQQLHARILAQDTALLLPRRVSDAGTPAVTPPPVSATSLVGREVELERLLAALAERRIVTVTGPGGVGKTRLALAAADALAGERELCFVDLSGLAAGDGDEVSEAVARGLGLHLGAASGPEAVTAALGDRSLLVIVDEAEQQPDQVAHLVSAVTGGCRNVGFLVTSRVPLQILGEARVPLAPLAVPAPGAERAEVLASPAVSLLVDRLRDHHPELRMESADVDLISAFARRLDGLPLALELVAGYAGTHALAEMADLLDAPLDLTAADLGRPERHRSLRDALRWTSAHLAPGHHRVLRRLAVFAGHVDLETARHVVGSDCGSPEAIHDAVRSLARESLLQVDRSQGGLRFRMLRTVRELMLEQLRHSGELDGLSARHRAWFASPHVAGSSRAVIEHVRAHYDDHLAALRSAVAARDATASVALLLRLGRWWEARELAAPAQRWTDRVLADVPLDASQRARVLALRGSMMASVDAEASRADLLTALPQLEIDEDGEALLLSHAALALVLTTSGLLDEALVHAEAAVAAARRWEPTRLGVALSVLAVVAVEKLPALAEQAAGEALELFMSAEIGDDTPAEAANIAWALFGLGRPGDGLRVIERGIAAVPSDVLPIYLPIHLGWARLLLGDARAALDCFAESLTGDERPETRWHADVFTGAACALAVLGHDDAVELLAGADRLVAETGHVLAGWQQEVVVRTRTTVRGREVPWVAGRGVTGRDLAQRVRAAAAALPGSSRPA